MIYQLKELNESDLSKLVATTYESNFLHRRKLTSLTNLYKEIQNLDKYLLKCEDEIHCFLSMCSISYMERYKGFKLPLKSQYYVASSKTVSYNINERRMKRLLEILEANNYIDIYYGYGESIVNSMRTIIVYLDKISKYLDTKGHKSQGLREPEENKSVIEVVDTEKTIVTKVYNYYSGSTETAKEIVFKNTKGMNGMTNLKSKLFKYNKLMEEVEVTLDGEVLPIVYKRRFHNTLNKCGRFISTIQNIRSSDRERFMIDGKKTVELDYQACHPRLIAQIRAYQLDYDFDPYQVPKLIEKGFDRQDIKQFIYPILYTENETRAIQAIASTLRRYTSIKVTPREVIDSFLEHNSYIEDYKYTKGLYEDLQYIESAMCEFIIGSLGDLGIHVIHIHDSFIVDYQYLNDLYLSMQLAWVAAVGLSGVDNCKIKGKIREYT